MGEPLAEIDTDKATMEMQALSNGVLRKILINEAKARRSGNRSRSLASPMRTFHLYSKRLPEKAPQPSTKTAEPTAPESQPAQPETAAAPPEISVSAKETEPAAQPSRDDGRQLISPIAARMAAEAGVNLKSLQGSGPGGRIVKRDIEAAMTSKPASASLVLQARSNCVEPAWFGQVKGPSMVPQLIGTSR